MPVAPPARPSLPRPAEPPGRPASDVVSDLLHAVRLRGAVYFAVEASAPWVAEAPPAAQLASHIMPGAPHVIEYHAVVSGRVFASLVDGPAVELGPGDIVLFPKGDAHVMASAPGMRGPRDLPHRARARHERLPILVDFAAADAPDRARLICGFLACDALPFNPLLGSLPRLLHVPRGERTRHVMLDHMVEAALVESRAPRPGGEAALARMSELMFVEVVRNHLATITTSAGGWLSGLRDPIVGRALGALHARPAIEWTLDKLGREVGASRSTLAERFTDLVGEPPMQYLTRWRMQLAASRIADGATLAEVAPEVGYGSEASLSRAFKKVVGVAPAEWRASRGGV
ncbi:MAG: AraC family transcriptional regulator [Deltaproteobacteria bacterium]|nr:AraC family transcriptional regulator [Deltaproteobacteria bacterium]